MTTRRAKRARQLRARGAPGPLGVVDAYVGVERLARGPEAVAAHASQPPVPVREEAHRRLLRRAVRDDVHGDVRRGVGTHALVEELLDDAVAVGEDDAAGARRLRADTRWRPLKTASDDPAALVTQALKEKVAVGEQRLCSSRAKAPCIGPRERLGRFRRCGSRRWCRSPNRLVDVN